jgi:hypothetical protein
MIPRGVENPSQVFHAFQDLRNWYDGDWENTKLYDLLDEDDIPMSYSETNYTAAARGNEVLAANNVRLTEFMMHRVSFDPWNGLGLRTTDFGTFGLDPIMLGDMTPAQLQETFKQSMEAALAALYR